MRRIPILFLAEVAVVLAACGSPVQPPLDDYDLAMEVAATIFGGLSTMELGIETASPAVSRVPPPAEPSGTPVASVTEPARAFSLDGTPIPGTLQGMSPATAPDLTLLARWGKGRINHMGYSPDGGFASGEVRGRWRTA